MRGGRGADWTGIPGGKFSLGRLRDGSGYCVGAVVESRMGATEDGDGLAGRGIRSGTGKDKSGGNGMKDVWVVGEGFFRGVGAVFDVSYTSADESNECADDSEHVRSNSRESGFVHIRGMETMEMCDYLEG